MMSKRTIGLGVYAGLSLWAGAMLWWAAIEIAVGGEWAEPVSWLASSVAVWAYWYWKVIR